MEQITRYMLSIICAAILCAIVAKLPSQDAATKKLIQIVVGIFMVFTLIKPLAQLHIKDPAHWLEDFTQAAQNAAAKGEEQTNNALMESIKQQLESYILDKAASMGASIEVELVLSMDGLPAPVGAVLKGDVSPYHKVQIQYILENELGITGENQIWKST